ncbi:MAG: class IV adenylate cyclase [Halanaeroarchaeum sp.]
MYEVEVKVRADHEPVREALRRRDATPVGAVEQADRYFDAPHRDFAERDEALRLRLESDADGDAAPESKLAYKGPLVESESKTREEIETPVVSPTDVEAILEALGFEVAATVEKHRERWRVGEYVVSLDDVSGLGQFVEVEGKATKVTVPDVRDGALEVLRDLDLDPDEQIRTSYLGLLLGGSGAGE